MNFKTSSLVVLAASSLFFFSFFTSANAALNITNRLNEYPDLIAFNDLLTQTKLSESINRRRTITVLVVDNNSIGGLNGRPLDEIQRILSNHVILDYYDLKKLKRIERNSSVTTLYQTTGNAEGNQGYLTITHLPGNEFVFGSAVKDSLPVAKFVKSIYTRPFNISILQVSQPIVAPGLGEVILPPPPPPSMPPKMSKSNVSSPSEAGIEEEFAPSESPIEAPEEAPAPAPVEPPAKSPPAPSKDEEETPASGVSHMYAGSVVVVAAFMAMVLNLVGF